MKAAYYVGNKSFEVRDIAPTPPEADEIQVKIAFSGICGTDLHAYHGDMDKRIGHNRILGHETSGTIAALGAGVSGFAIGDPVVVRPLKPCGDCPACRAGFAHICHNLKFLGLDTDGAFQELWTVPAYAVHKLPSSLSLQHAALCEPVAVACHDVRRGRVKAGEDVLVIGGGPIGMLIAMVARNEGANVVISEINDVRLAIAEQLGFATVNPAKADVVAEINARTGGKGADVVFEVSGTTPGAALMTEVAATRGRIVMVAIYTKKQEIDLFRFFWRELELIGARVYEPEDFDQAIALIANGVIDAKTMISEVYPLDQVRQAFQSIDGNARSMKVLLAIS